MQTIRCIRFDENEDETIAGIELRLPAGNSNGTVDGIQYFKCIDNYGMFCNINRLNV